MLAEEVCGLAAGQAAARDKNVSAGEDLAVENISDGEELLVVDAGDGGLCDERTGGEDDGASGARSRMNCSSTSQLRRISTPRFSHMWM